MIQASLHELSIKHEHVRDDRHEALNSATVQMTPTVYTGIILQERMSYLSICTGT